MPDRPDCEKKTDSQYRQIDTERRIVLLRSEKPIQGGKNVSFGVMFSVLSF
jgi:hypothetical protein